MSLSGGGSVHWERRAPQDPHPHTHSHPLLPQETRIRFTSFRPSVSCNPVERNTRRRDRSGTSERDSRDTYGKDPTSLWTTRGVSCRVPPTSMNAVTLETGQVLGPRKLRVQTRSNKTEVRCSVIPSSFVTPQVQVQDLGSTSLFSLR